MQKKKYFSSSVILIVICIAIAGIFISSFSFKNKETSNTRPLTNDEGVRIDDVAKKDDNKDGQESNESNNISPAPTSNSNSNSNSNVTSTSNSNTNVNSNANKPVTIPNIPLKDEGVVTTGKMQIVNKCGSNSLQALDEFYQDSEYTYYFRTMQSNCIYVRINGSEYTIKFALNSHLVTMKELTNLGFKCLKKPRHLATK